MTFDEKLLKTRFVVDSQKAHITVNTSLCSACAAPCVSICPAQCYQKDKENLLFSWAGCLECGSCRLVCPSGAITWNYPRGGFGVSFRFG